MSNEARRYEVHFALDSDREGQVTVKVIAWPAPAIAGGRTWRGSFAEDDLLDRLARTFALNDASLHFYRREFSLLSSGRLIQFASNPQPLLDCPPPTTSVVTEDKLIELGLTEDL